MRVLSSSDAAVIMDAMREAARQEILPRYQRLGLDGIRTKTGPDDLVTDADIGAERVLSAMLLEHFPDALVIGEEAVSNDASILDRLASPGLAIIIDPVDGTWNFANALPVFGMIVAIVDEGQTIGGFIHYPVVGDFIMALKGEGAFHIAADGTRTAISVAAPVPLDHMAGLVPLTQFSPEQQRLFAPNMLQFSRTTTFRCSAYEYRLISQGSMAFCINAGLMPWDHAAGHLIHAEAGGYSALLGGEAYRPAMTEGHLLLASDEASWNAIAAVFADFRVTTE